MMGSHQVKMSKKYDQITNVPDNLMQYPKKVAYLRQKYLKQKTIEELKSTSHQKIIDQFDYLGSADISYDFFSAAKKQNNRYIDIYPYKHSRVKVQSLPNFHTNANYVRSILDSQIFAIFGQAPFNQFDSLWEAVYFNNIKLITMLCSFYDPKRGPQADKYWPDENNQALFSDGTLTVLNLSKKQIFPSLYENIFEITGKQGKKQVKHYQWTGWKDLKKPIDNDLKIFQFLLEQSQNQIQNKRIPWIHCSAGIGRTGTFGGIIDALRYLKVNKKISIFKLVENMRKYRYFSVQTAEQYEFIYQYLGSIKL